MLLLAALFIVACGQKQDEMLKNKIDDRDFVIVDIHSPEERALTFIPTSIPKEEFEKNKGKYGDTSIITYRTIGYRSGLYTKKLRERKINACNLKDGPLAWAHHRNHFTDKEGRNKKQIHVYKRDWILVPEEYEAI